MLPFIIAGLVSGSVYGLAGVGLVLTYKTSGIFNFSQGALGTVAAFIFYFLYYQHGVPLVLAILISVPLLGVALGLCLERFAKKVAHVSLAMQVVGTVGLLLLIESVINILYGPSTTLFPQFLPARVLDINGIRVGVAEIIVFAISVVLTAVLYVYLRAARMGKAMRAVVDNPELLGLTGMNPTVVRRWAWVIGSTFATLSGLLLAPSVGLNATVLTLLIVQAFGAAAIGRFTSLPWTWVGGLVIGVGGSLITEHVNSESILGGLSASLPFIVLFLVILVSPRGVLASRAVGQVHTMRASWTMPGRIQWAGGGVLVLFLIFVPQLVGFDITGWTVALAYVVILLSLGLLVRTSGQVSLCQMTFAAIGAVAYSKLTVGAGIPAIPALIIAALIAVPVGALIAVPAIRLSGLYLALATFGFGLLVQDMFYQSGLMFGLSTGIIDPTPSFGWLHASDTTALYYFTLVVLALVAGIVIVLNRTRLGRLLRGLSDSPTALATSGSAVVVTQVLVFCLSAAIAAVGGALLGMTVAPVTGDTFDPTLSLTLFVVIVITVGSEPWYALLAGAGIGLVPTYFTSGNVTFYLELVFGVSAVLVAVGGASSMPDSWRRAFDKLGGRTKAASKAGRPGRAGTARPGVPSASRISAKGLELRDLRVAFGGLVAVSGVSMEAPPGRITGLIGPNGAGKTTAFDACSGLNRRVGGHILLGGQDVSRVGPSARARRGLGRTFQQMRLFESMTVRENVALGREAAMAGTNLISQVMRTSSERAEIGARVAESLEICGLEEVAHRAVSELPTGQRRLVELARCLAGDFGFLMLDEPSSGLDRRETQRFGEILQDVVGSRGIGILLVEHDMALVMEVCQSIYVLDFGQIISYGTPVEIRASATVRAAYLGVESLGSEASS